MAGYNFTIMDSEVIEGRFYATLNEQTSINTLYWRANTFTFPTTAEHMAAAVETPLAAAFKSLMAADATYRGATFRRVSPTKSAYYFTTANAGVGTAGDIALPRQSCGMFTKVTSVAGRPGRGRMYVPFPAAADDDTGGVPTAGYMLNLGILAAQVVLIVSYMDGGNPMDMIPVLRHGTIPVTWTSLESAIARQKWATQRRRGSYGRANVAPF